MILDFATKYRSAAAITCTYTFLGHMAMQLFYKMKTQAEGTNSKLWLSRMGTTNGSHEWSHKSGPRMGTTDGSHEWRPKVEPTNT